MQQIEDSGLIFYLQPRCERTWRGCFTVSFEDEESTKQAIWKDERVMTINKPVMPK